jgi:hypothetical protein
MGAAETRAAYALEVINEQLKEAIAAPKCHQCGCLRQTVEALAETQAGRSELAPMLGRARSVFIPKKYDCLGCPVCYPAIATNAFVAAYPEEGAGLGLCPAEEPEEGRAGRRWCGSGGLRICPDSTFGRPEACSEAGGWSGSGSLLHASGIGWKSHVAADCPYRSTGTT